MRNHWFFYISVFLIFVCAGMLHPQQDDIYRKYCILGKAGYTKLYNERGGQKSPMDDFWGSFKDMIIDMNDAGEFTNIRECTRFWDHYKQDEYFDVAGNRVRAEKKLVEKIFFQAIHNYWNKIHARMARFLWISETVNNVSKYTQNRRYANKLARYKTIHTQISSIAFPQSLTTATNFKNLFSQLIRVVGPKKVDPQKKQKIEEYIAACRECYNIGIPGGTFQFDSKSKAYGRKKNKLVRIHQLAAVIDSFGINGKATTINQRTIYNENKEKYYSKHSKTNNLIDKLYEAPLAGSVDSNWLVLDTVKKNVLRIANSLANLESELEVKVDKFRKIPGETNAVGFEDYFENHKSSTDKIAGIVNAKFKNLLSGECNHLWSNGIRGKRFDNASIHFQSAVIKYRKYFGATSYDERSGFLKTYYDLRFKIPELYRYVKKYSFRAGDFEHMQANWGIRSIEELEGIYKDYVHKEAEKTFTKLRTDGKKRDKADFDKFKSIYKHAANDMGEFNIDEPWSSIYARLNRYYHGNKKQRKKAGEEIVKEYSQVASVHGIKVHGTVSPGRTDIQGGGKKVIELKTGTVTHLPPASDFSSLGIAGPLVKSIASTKQQPGPKYRVLVMVRKEAEKKYDEDEVIAYIKNLDHFKFHSRRINKSARNRILEFKRLALEYGFPFEEPAILMMVADLLAKTRNEVSQLIILDELKGSLKDYTNKFPDGASLIPEADIKILYESVKNFNEVAGIYRFNRRGAFKRGEEKEFDKRVKAQTFENLTPAQKARLRYMAAGLYLEKGQSHIPHCFHLYRCFIVMSDFNLEKLKVYDKGESFSKNSVWQELKKEFNALITKQIGKAHFVEELKNRYDYEEDDAEEVFKEMNSRIRGVDLETGEPESETVEEEDDEQKRDEGKKDDREIIKFLKDIKAYMDNPYDPAASDRGKCIKLIIAPKMSNKDFSEYKLQSRLPVEFDYQLYEFLRLFYRYTEGKSGMKRRAKRILAKKEEEDPGIAKLLKEMYEEKFESYVK